MLTLPPALAALSAYRQFIVYQLVPDYERPGKTHKYPLHYLTGERKNAHDSEIWTDFETASRTALVFGRGYGVGFTFTEHDPFFFIDIDSCAIRDPLGNWLGWTPIVAELCGQLPGAAVEISQSGDGLHIIGRGTAPTDRRKKDRTNTLFDLYTEKRFCALTGTSALGDANTEHTAALRAITAKHLFHDAAVPGAITGWTTEAVPEYRSYSTDEQLIARGRGMESKAYQAAHAFSNGETVIKSRFEDLWVRNVEVLSRLYPPDPNNPSDEYNGSIADAALFQYLAFLTGKNCERIKRIAFMSALVRDKWERDDYVDATIIKQCARQVAVLEDTPVTEAPQSSPIPIARYRKVAAYLNNEATMELFKGCIYIQDHNAVLMPNGDIIDQPRFKAKFGGRAFQIDDIGDRTTKDAWEAFLQHQAVEYPQVDGTCFRPDLPFQMIVRERGRSWVNTYLAPEIKRRPGDVTPFLNLVKKLLPNGDDALILLSYLAAVAQNPGVKFKWAVFLQGTEGNGKSTIVRCLRHALGHKYIFNLKAPMIENNFNSWLEGNLLYVADDIYTLQDRGNLIEALQTLITEEEQPITYKGIDSVQKWVCGNFLFTDNHRDALRKTEAGRRIATLYCAQQSKAKRNADGLTDAWFADIYYPWLESGGYEFVSEYLHTVQIDARYNPAGRCKEAPVTSSTGEAIEDGRTGVENDILEWIELGEPGFCGNFVSATMLKRRLTKPMSELKIKETLGRLGYEYFCMTAADVNPDGRRAKLFVKIDSLASTLTDSQVIVNTYNAAQQAAMTRHLTGGMKP